MLTQRATFPFRQSSIFCRRRLDGIAIATLICHLIRHGGVGGVWRVCAEPLGDEYRPCRETQDAGGDENVSHIYAPHACLRAILIALIQILWLRQSRLVV